MIPVAGQLESDDAGAVEVDGDGGDGSFHWVKGLEVNERERQSFHWMTHMVYLAIRFCISPEPGDDKAQVSDEFHPVLSE